MIENKKQVPLVDILPHEPTLQQCFTLNIYVFFIYSSQQAKLHELQTDKTLVNKCQWKQKLQHRSHSFICSWPKKEGGGIMHNGQPTAFHIEVGRMSSSTPVLCTLIQTVLSAPGESASTVLHTLERSFSETEWQQARGGLVTQISLHSFLPSEREYPPCTVSKAAPD